MEPTEKQIKYACEIEEVTGVLLPKRQTKETLRKYISENVETFKSRINKNPCNHDNLAWTHPHLGIYDC